MTSFGVFSEFGTIMDALAIACCLAMMLMVLRHRRECRSMTNGKPIAHARTMAEEMASQSVSRQSQKIYANLQRALEKEFSALQPTGSNDGWGLAADHPHESQGLSNHNAAARTSDRRSYRFRQAEQMLAQGADGGMIRRHCALGEGEFELLKGLQQYRKSPRP